GERMTYYPYGEEKTSTAENREKFGTYTRDNPATDYADQRYYGVGNGRFMTPDPSMDNVDYSDPTSWNAYAYVNGDPINFGDPDGLQTCGEIPILGGKYKGQTVSQVMTGTTGEDLLAQIMWHEGGTIYQSDLKDAASVAAYAEDLTSIGTAVLNQWDVDNGVIKVYQNGRAACPLGQCLDRSLKDIVIAISKDNTGSIFNSNGNMRSTDAAKLKGILNTTWNAGPVVQDSSGQWVNQGCEGVLESLTLASGLLSGDVARAKPNGLTLLFWNQASADSTTTFPGNVGYTGWRGDRVHGETFWGLSSTPPPVRRPPPGRGRGR
ncbi:MAG: RHS repeat-associated core domain-containing protein, partial [Candidatus Solibacter sp.]